MAGVKFGDSPEALAQEAAKRSGEAATIGAATPAPPPSEVRSDYRSWDIRGLCVRGAKVLIVGKKGANVVLVFFCVFFTPFSLLLS